ncbi:primosomal protein N' [Patescibacteria group bacterium]
MSEKGYLISVVPTVKIPMNRDQFFYYEFNEKIPIGSKVKAPFGRSKIEGIVIDVKSDFERMGNIKLKKIEKLLEKNFLTPEQIKLAQFISDYYLTSLGIVMKSFAIKKVKERKPFKYDTFPKKESIQNTKEQESAINKITEHNKDYVLKKNRFLLFGPASSGKTQVYFKSIKQIIKNEGQALVVLPELTSIAQETERYGSFLGIENIAILHSKIPKGTFFKNWQAIKSGEAKIILGTRQSIFAPFNNLKIIIIDEEHDVSHKQWDMTPRYDARRSAEKLAEIHKAKIVLGSATPRIDTFFRAKQGEVQLLKLPHLAFSKSRNVEIVSMVRERWNKNYSPISKKLEAEIQWMLKNKFQSILFINRQGMSSFSVCKSCKTTFKCPKCERALVYQKNGYHKCIHCTYKSSFFPTCSKCQSNEFKNVGIGTQKIEKELEKTFASARIQRIDADATKTIRAQEKIWKDFSSGKIDILIGTQMITKNWDLKNIGLSAILDADSLFSFPDYLTDEKAFAHISQTIGRSGRTGSRIKGTALVQTFHDENQIIQMAKSSDYEKFYEEEIENREMLKYPPFSHIIKILFQDENKDFAQQEVNEFYKEIYELGNEDIKIYPPQDSLVSNIRGKHRKQIIFKVNKYPGLPKKLLGAISKLKKGWSIDIDPVNVA